MRRVGLAAAALLLAACAVDIEGAACRITGTTDDCPSGQACGTDLTCSRRAASCTPCIAGETRTCSDRSVLVCSAEGDGACGAMVLDESCDALEECKESGPGVAACLCTRLAVDPGAAAPLPACTFGSVRDAIAASTADVTAIALRGATPATYAEGEVVLAVPAGVLLEAEDVPAQPDLRVVQTEGLVLGPGAALRGLTVERAGPAAGAGVTVACAGSAAPVFLDAVVVRPAPAGDAFATGVRLEGACPVDLAGVAVRGAAGAGLEVDRADPVATTSATGLVLDGNGTGVRLVKGDLALDAPLVLASGRDGIAVAGAGADEVRLSVTGGELRGSGAAGSAGVRIGCAAGAAGVTLDAVEVTADAVAGGFEAGVIAGGACPVSLGGLHVTGASGPGLQVSRDAPDAAVVATGAALDGNGTGVLLTQGALDLQGPTVTTSGLHAIEVLGSIDDAVSLSVSGGVLRGRGVLGSAGVRIGCAGTTAPVTLGALTVEADPGAGGFGTGVLVQGTCPVSLDGVTVTGAAGAGLEVDRVSADAQVVARALTLDGNGTGVRLAAGDLQLLEGSVVRNNLGHGIDALGALLGAVRLTVANGAIHGNGAPAGAGIVVQSPGRLALTDTVVCGNAGFQPSLSGEREVVGGLLAIGNAPAEQQLRFERNRLHGNGGNQVVVSAGEGVWRLDAPGCGADMNVISGYDTGLGLTAIAAQVTARFARWQNLTPALDADYRTLVEGEVVVGLDYCANPVVLTCP